MQNRAQPAAGAVGVSGGLTALSVNGTPVELTEGVTAYTVDGQGASVLTVTPTAANPDANIYVSAQRVASGMDSAPVTAVGKLRIIVQEEDREPVIYILNVANTATPEDGADLTGLTLTPGGVTAVPDASEWRYCLVSNCEGSSARYRTSVLPRACSLAQVLRPTV